MRIAFMEGDATGNTTSKLLVNSITFYEVNNEQIALIKKHQQKEKLLINGSTTRTYEVMNFGNLEVYKLLTFYFPNENEGSKYGDFEFLFKQQSYQQWKKAIIKAIPELNHLFNIAEEEALIRRQIYHIDQSLKELSFDNSSPRLLRSNSGSLRESLSSLSLLKKSLEEELQTLSSPSRNPSREFSSFSNS